MPRPKASRKTRGGISAKKAAWIWESVAHHLKRMKVAVNQIVHSGKTRALTTARIMAEHLQPPSGIAEAPGLAPLDDPQVFADRVAAVDQDLMVVGHSPPGEAGCLTDER